jgi:hypothetical protein
MDAEVGVQFPCWMRHCSKALAARATWVTGSNSIA